MNITINEFAKRHTEARALPYILSKPATASAIFEALHRVIDNTQERAR